LKQGHAWRILDVTLRESVTSREMAVGAIESAVGQPARAGDRTPSSPSWRIAIQSSEGLRRAQLIQRNDTRLR
jgi:hypothetical protein